VNDPLNCEYKKTSSRAHAASTRTRMLCISYRVNVQHVLDLFENRGSHYSLHITSRRWRALKKESGYGGGWRTEWATTPKARGASRAGDENEQSVHGGRLESARDNTSMKSQKRQRRFQVEARTVNDGMKQTTRDRRGSSPVSKDR